MTSSSKAVEFEISLEKLSIKLKGDVHVAERLSGELTVP
jgi:hypothetical protein